MKYLYIPILFILAFSYTKVFGPEKNEFSGMGRAPASVIHKEESAFERFKKNFQFRKY
jgi:hypothetical protein